MPYACRECNITFHRNVGFRLHDLRMPTYASLPMTMPIEEQVLKIYPCLKCFIFVPDKCVVQVAVQTCSNNYT